MSLPRVTACFDRLCRDIAIRKIPIDLAEGDIEHFPTFRDLAYTTDATGTLRIVVSPRLEEESDARIEGVLRHEFGHVIYLARGFPQHTERAADSLAHALFGDAIHYDADDIQVVGAPGVSPRPLRLGR